MRRWWWMALIVALALLNLSAGWHAYRLTHFSDGARRTRGPDQLTPLQRVAVLLSGVEMPRPQNGPVPPGYRVETVAGRLEVWVAQSDGPTVLMFPGHAVAKSVLLPEAQLWREWGWRPVLVDFRGCGGSAGDTTTLGWHEAEDVAVVAEWAGRPAILHGQSMGAAAILRAVATRNVPARGLVLESVFDRLLQTVSRRYHAMGLPAFPFARLLLFWGGVQHGFNPLRHNPVEYAKQVKLPALMLGGQSDAWVAPDEIREVAANMGGPVRLVLLPAGHGSLYQQAEVDYRRALEDWLASQLRL